MTNYTIEQRGNDRLNSEQCAVVRSHRRALHKTQDDIAQLLGCSRKTYNQLEAGQAPLNTAARQLLVQELRIPAQILLGVNGPGIEIPLPTVGALMWDQFYGGAAPTLITLLPLVRNWLDDQPRVPSSNGLMIAQLYQSCAVTLNDALLPQQALTCINAGIQFAEFLAGSQELNADLATAFYRRSRIWVRLGRTVTGTQRAEFFDRALTDARRAVQYTPAERNVIKVVSLQNLAEVELLAEAGPQAAATSMQQALALGSGTTHPTRDAGMVLSPAGLQHAAARVFLAIAEQGGRPGALAEAEEYIGDALDNVQGQEHRWSLDMQLTHIQIMVAQGNVFNAADLAVSVAAILTEHQSPKLIERAQRIVTRLNSGGRSDQIRAKRATAESFLKQAAQRTMSDLA